MQCLLCFISKRSSTVILCSYRGVLHGSTLNLTYCQIKDECHDPGDVYLHASGHYFIQPHLTPLTDNKIFLKRNVMGLDKSQSLGMHVFLDYTIHSRAGANEIFKMLARNCVLTL